MVRPTDFVYLDPPYPPLNGTSYFRHYTKDRFSWDQHEELASLAVDLSHHGTTLLMTNADIPPIRRLYADFHIISLPVVRFVTSSSVKHTVRELVITNYLTPSELPSSD